MHQNDPFPVFDGLGGLLERRKHERWMGFFLGWRPCRGALLAGLTYTSSNCHKSHISYSRGALLAGLTSSQCPNMSSENTPLLKSHIHIIVTPNLFDLFLLLQKTPSQAIIYLDVVKSRVQADDPSKPLYRGTLDCVRQSYKRLVDRSPNSTVFVLDFYKDNRTIISSTICTFADNV